MTSLPEAEKGGAAKQRPYPLILPAHSERGFPFFCLNRASSFFTVFGLSPTERQSMLAKLLKTSWDFQVCLCVKNLTFGPIFSSKTTKYRRISSVPLLHIGVPPCHGDRGPLVFFWASLYNGNHSLRQEKNSCPVNLRGVGNDFSITFLCF